jgi:DNA-binding LytR/AlgR family response regulator
MTSEVRLLIVEDDAVIAADLAALLNDLGYTVCAICSDANSALRSIPVHQPDLLLLDINLGQGKDGIAIAERINAAERLPFVFVTGHTDRATLERVKGTRPAGFIIKPFDEDDLRTQIEIALARHAAQVDASNEPSDAQRQDFRIANVLFVRDKGRLVKVPVDDIRYAEADDNYVILHTADRRYAVATTLNKIEERLASVHFVRIHRSYLADVRRITGLREREALLGDVLLPVGRTHKEAVRTMWEAL